MVGSLVWCKMGVAKEAHWIVSDSAESLSFSLHTNLVPFNLKVEMKQPNKKVVMWSLRLTKQTNNYLPEKDQFNAFKVSFR